jgi:hypothetical protein
MFRRRRRVREIPFSFDSFLDVVANVCGIIIRLILVVWVGARSYSHVQNYLEPVTEPSPEAVAQENSSTADIKDPLEEELAQERIQLAEAEKVLLQNLRLIQQGQDWQKQLKREWAELTARRQVLGEERTDWEQRTSAEKNVVQAAKLTLEELRQRCGKLSADIQTLEKSPPVRQALHYRTPVSRPLEAEELMFECRRERVTFIDVAALLEEVKRRLHDKAETLRTTWEVQDRTGPVGPFQLRYQVERQRGALEGGLGGQPLGDSSFSYGVSSWRLEPITEVRGETLEAALRPGSEFRQIADGLDPKYAAVTFWVYPDSFVLYRKLRDYLYTRDLIVAGRPLPEGVPISSSRQGSASRGQ